MMKKLFLISLTSLILTVSCRTHIYTVKLDPQLYTFPTSYGQKLMGLIYYEKSNYFFTFDSEEKLDIGVAKNIKLLGGNKVITLNFINSSGSVVNQINNRTKSLLVKGFVVNDVSY